MRASIEAVDDVRMACWMPEGTLLSDRRLLGRHRGRHYLDRRRTILQVCD